MKITNIIIGTLLLVAYASCTLQDLMAAMTPTSTSPGCVSFSPYVENYTPNYGPSPPETLIRTLLNTLVSQTGFRCIHIYNLGPEAYRNTVKISQSLGIKVLANIYIDSSALTISDIDGAILTANTYKDTLLGISCGSETIYESNNPTGAKQAVERCINQLRAGGVTQPIGYIDVFTGWCNSEYPCTSYFRELEQLVDFVGLDDFPWWQNTYSRMFPCEPASNGANQTAFRYNELKRVASKPVLLTEYGWPSSRPGQDILSTQNVYLPNQERCGVANPTNQRNVNQGIVNWCAANGIPCCLFSAFNELWKGNGNPNDVNNFWGVCEGTAPYTCTNAPTGASGVTNAPASTVSAAPTTSTTVAVTTTAAPGTSTSTTAAPAPETSTTTTVAPAPGTTTTSRPGTSTSTTAAPAPGSPTTLPASPTTSTSSPTGNVAGDNDLRNSAISIASIAGLFIASCIALVM